MAERVQELDLGVRWSPIEEDAVLVVRGNLDARLVLSPHPDDVDQRDVVLRWDGVWYAVINNVNDEALHNHRLTAKHEGQVLWVGIVEDSVLTVDQIWRHHKELRGPGTTDNTADRVRHFVAYTKGQVVEVLAGSVDVERADGLLEGLRRGLQANP